MRKLFFKALNFIFAIANKISEIVFKYPFLVLLLVIAVVFAIVVLLVRKDTNVGGVLDKLLNFLKSKSPIDQASSIPKDREQAIGEADKKGFVQHKVEELERSLNPFRDKSKIMLPNGKVIKLPTGILDTDVDTIIEAETEVMIIPTKSTHQKALEIQETIRRARTSNSSAKDLLARLKARRNA